MSNSILVSVKKALGIAEEYTVYDEELVLFINGVFSTLQQLGIGPSEGFEITGANEEWVSFYGVDKGLNTVRTYVVLRTKLIFDAPPNSFTVQALKEQIEQLEWRMNVHREDLINPDYVPPLGPLDVVVDGGSPE